MGVRFWVCVSLLTLSIILMFSNKKIRCLKLLEDLIKIFYNNKTNKISIFDLTCFFACPAVIGTSIVFGFDYYFSVEVSNALLTVFSILFTLLFGVMSLLTSTLDSPDSIKKKISNQAFTAVAFSMFSSLVSLILMIIYIVLLEKISSVICFQILSGVIIMLASNMIMLFFMIIKRSYVTSISK